MSNIVEYVIETDQGYLYARGSRDQIERWTRESSRFDGLNVLEIRPSDCDPSCKHRRWTIQT